MSHSHSSNKPQTVRNCKKNHCTLNFYLDTRWEESVRRNNASTPWISGLRQMPLTQKDVILSTDHTQILAFFKNHFRLYHWKQANRWTYRFTVRRTKPILQGALTHLKKFNLENSFNRCSLYVRQSTLSRSFHSSVPWLVCQLAGKF